MQQHKIDWLNMPGYKGETWNPIIGCSRISEGCEDCYAEKMARRLSAIALSKSDDEYFDVSGIGNYSLVTLNGKWNGKTRLVPNALEKPLKWRKPRMIFVCSMSDLFHENTPFEWIDKVFDVMVTNPDHLYLLLTKRPERALEYYKWAGKQVKDAGFDSYPSQSDNLLDYISEIPFIWLGVSVENQEQADKRIPLLLQIPAALRFISCEPLIGPVDLSQIRLLPPRECITHNILNGIPYDWDYEQYFPENRIEPTIQWVIAGGESGPKARPMHPDWVRSIRDQCEGTDVPFFFKQWGQWVDFDHCPDHLKKNCGPSDGYQSHSWYHQKGDRSLNRMYRVGSHQSGSQLDGKHYKIFPKI